MSTQAILRQQTFINAPLSTYAWERVPVCRIAVDHKRDIWTCFCLQRITLLLVSLWPVEVMSGVPLTGCPDNHYYLSLFTPKSTILSATQFVTLQSTAWPFCSNCSITFERVETGFGPLPSSEHPLFLSTQLGKFCSFADTWGKFSWWLYLTKGQTFFPRNMFTKPLSSGANTSESGWRWRLYVQDGDEADEARVVLSDAHDATKDIVSVSADVVFQLKSVVRHSSFYSLVLWSRGNPEEWSSYTCAWSSRSFVRLFPSKKIWMGFDDSWLGLFDQSWIKSGGIKLPNVSMIALQIRVAPVGI